MAAALDALDAGAAARALAAGVLARSYKFKADTLAWRLRLSYAERQAHLITTIGAYDFGKDERALARKIKKAAAERQRRRQRGAMPRHRYHNAGISYSAPWVELGMSRATWYRRGRSDPRNRDRPPGPLR